MFVINNGGYFFEISEDLDVDIKKFTGCRFFDTEKEMLEVVCKEQNLEMEEIEGGTMTVRETYGELRCYDDRACYESIDEEIGVEAFISEYFM